jgi:hypothetical protein
MTMSRTTSQSRPRVRASDPEPAITGNRLVYSRKEAAALLGGVSLATLHRLEQDGVLQP